MKILLSKIILKFNCYRKYRLIRWGVPVFTLSLLFIVFDLIFPFEVDIQYSKTILSEEKVILKSFLSKDQKWRLKTDHNEISPILLQMILTKEDHYFYYHPGVNPISIFRAALKNILSGKRISGASTISMQVIRLLKPRPRTYISKFIEIINAIQLEMHYSKSEILDMYLSLVPFGGNIEGIKSASLIYFQKLPKNLSIAQCATLAIIPNKPTSLSLSKNSLRIIAYRNKLLKNQQRNLIRINGINQKLILSSLNEPLDIKRIDLQTLAPHWSIKIAKENSYDDSKSEIITTISINTQNKVEKIVMDYISGIKLLGITNAAVIVLDNKSMEIKAYVGSVDFNDVINEGQNNGAHTLRSPGSTLKPFLYGYAFDQGIITPKTILADIPIDFAGYQPENSDQIFRGKVTASEALAYSLNIPAVKILNSTGKKSFCRLLKKGGLTSIDEDDQELGLSLILGGCGANLEQLTNLYSSIANKGKFRLMTGLKNIDSKFPSSKQIELLSPESAYILSEILSGIRRPDLPSGYENTSNLPRIAWKTGTSFGYKDAWSIGFNTQYTIGVWVGNFNGFGAPGLTGSQIATPLLFNIFNCLPNTLDWFKIPEGLQKRTVCSETGLIPNEFCNSLESDYYNHKSAKKICDHMKWIWVSEDEKVSYCTACIPINNVKQIMVNNYDPELVKYYIEQNIAPELPPPHNNLCRSLSRNSTELKMITPTKNSTYYKMADKEIRILLSAEHDPFVKKLNWFVNGKYYRSVNVDEKLFWSPIPGKYKITVSDDMGNVTHRETTVVQE